MLEFIAKEVQTDKLGGGHGGGGLGDIEKLEPPPFLTLGTQCRFDLGFDSISTQYIHSFKNKPEDASVLLNMTHIQKIEIKVVIG